MPVLYPHGKLNPTTDSVYRFLTLYLRTHGYAPSQREIARNCYLSQPGVLRHLTRLEALGYVWREPGQPRSIQLLKAVEETEPQLER